MASFVAYLLRINMSIAGENMMADLGLSKIQLGMILSAFAWGYAIFQFPGGIGALLVPITTEAFGWVPALATGSVFAIIGVGLWFFVRADKPITLHST